MLASSSAAAAMRKTGRQARGVGLKLEGDGHHAKPTHFE
jgi:hypothetical protein